MKLPTTSHRRAGLLVDALARHNPFYFLSAGCMLAGCLALTNSLSWVSIPLPRLLTLMATLSVYQLLLVGLALALMRGRQLWRDGRVLLTLEAIFLVDITFLSAELMTTHLPTGMGLGAALLILAVVKLCLVQHVLDHRIDSPRTALMVVQLAMLLALPGVLSQVDAQRDVHGRDLYLAWWIIALLPAGFELVDHVWPRRQGMAPLRTYLVLPWLSLVLHAAMLHYVYRVPYTAPMSAPMLLSLALLLGRATPAGWIRAIDRHVLTVLLALGAVLVSGDSATPRERLDLLLPSLHIALTSLQLAITGAYVVIVHRLFRRYAWSLLTGGAMLALLVLLGPSRQDVIWGATETWAMLRNVAGALVPANRQQWGVLAVVSAFAFLALGAALSLRRPPATDTVTSAAKPASPQPGEPMP